MTNLQKAIMLFIKMDRLEKELNKTQEELNHAVMILTKEQMIKYVEETSN